MKTFERLFEEHAAASFSKQYDLYDVIGQNASWEFHIESGEIVFDQKHRFPIQVLGTESEISHTWQWIWANTSSDIPEKNKKSAYELKKLGEKEHMQELTKPQVSLNNITGHQIAMIASGICQSACYYRCPYDNGAAYVLIDASEIKKHGSKSEMRFIDVFTQLIKTFSFNHKNAFLSFARYKKYTCKENGNEMEVTSPQKKKIRAVFDKKDRLVDIALLGN